MCGEGRAGAHERRGRAGRCMRKGAQSEPSARSAEGERCTQPRPARPRAPAKTTKDTREGEPTGIEWGRPCRFNPRNTSRGVEGYTPLMGG